MSTLAGILTTAQNGTIAVNGLIAQFKTIFSNLWGNKRDAISGAYTVLNTDKAQTIALGGGAFYTLTLNAASTYDTNFFAYILNEDTTRAKTIAASGLANFFLWPGQSILIFSQNNVWHAGPSFQRWAKSGVQFFADPVNGSNSNDGLAPGAGGAVATITQAAQLLYQNIDCQNGEPTINLAAGTYIESVGLSGQLTGANVCLIAGAGSGSVTWKPGGSGYCLLVGDNAECQVQGIKFDNAGGANDSIAIASHQTGVIDVLNDINFGTFPSAGASRHISMDQGGFINLPSNYTISGLAAWHINAGPGAVISQGAAGTITFTGTYTIGIMYRLTGVRMTFAGVESYSVGTVTVTSQYAVDFGTMLQLQGTTPPGGGGTGNGIHGCVVA